MRHRTALPPQLGSVFRVADADASGATRWRRDTRDLARPFHGVRSVDVPDTFDARLDCYSPRLGPGHRFAGVTAARRWGLPLPWFWSIAEVIEVVVPTDAAPPRTRGVQGRRLSEERAPSIDVEGLPVIDPVATLFTLAPRLSVDQAVVIIDARLAESENYPGLGSSRPLASVDSIRIRLRDWGRFPGVGKIREALELAHGRVESPKETETRVMIVRAGMPEPEVQHEVRHRGRRVAKVDLAYPDLKIAIEYEGDGHRTDKEQWREDIRRQRELEALGWIVIRLTADDLAGGRRAFLSHLARAISARGVRA